MAGQKPRQALGFRVLGAHGAAGGFECFELLFGLYGAAQAFGGGAERPGRRFGRFAARFARREGFCKVGRRVLRQRGGRFGECGLRGRELFGGFRLGGGRAFPGGLRRGEGFARAGHARPDGLLPRFERLGLLQKRLQLRRKGLGGPAV